MKKLIVIAAVLAFSVAASAAPMWTFSVGGAAVDQAAAGDVVTASLGVDTITGLTITGGTIALSDVTIDSSTILAATFGGAPVVAGNTFTMGTYVFGAAETAAYQPGDAILSMTFTVSPEAAAAGQVDLDSTLNFAQGTAPAPFPSATLPVPEPMTLGLLGLGGLFLRRRK